MSSVLWPFQIAEELCCFQVATSTWICTQQTTLLHLFLLQLVISSSPLRPRFPTYLLFMWPDCPLFPQLRDSKSLRQEITPCNVMLALICRPVGYFNIYDLASRSADSKAFPLDPTAVKYELMFAGIAQTFHHKAHD